ncbi:hypothetical protein HJO_00775 [Hyphomonas johnsonii MHS-2]|uniref:Ribbon-helix-helix protein CopG domain-containing protein n=2 Tax=Hyphomonas johnsonii TaxID=81031 RepID=A0A059FT67_9PROT|nr:hypothetical protein HJO_00775 [Hyphomonas johnsonii MHS-2]
MTVREPKKSEMLEIRVSHETKEALHARARSEGRTVSDIVRSQISDYIGAGDAGARAGGHIGGLAGRVKAGVATLARLPRVLAAAAAALVVMVLFSQSASLAQDVSLELDGTIVSGDRNVHSFGTEIVLAPDTPVSFPVQSDTDPYTVTVTLHSPTKGTGPVQIGFTISHGNAETEATAASPSVLIDFDEKARIEFRGADGAFYGITARARPVSK